VADKSYATPVYRSWPERPYRVLGSIQSSNPQKKWNESDTAQSACFAKGEGGDALIVLDGDETGAGQNATPAFKLFPTSSPSALVIRWKSQSEVDEESHRLDGLRAYMKRSYPALGLGSKNELWEISVEYVTWLGLDINSPSGAQKVEEALSSLATTSADASPAKWLFKGMLQTKSSSGRSTETVIYGIATLIQKGDNVVIDSQPGTPSVDFHGKIEDGQLRGQLDFSSGTNTFTSKAEGLASSVKIVLNSQWHAAGKPVQGTFTFLH
jgi:hypothetical protein